MARKTQETVHTVGPGPVQARMDLMDLRSKGIILTWPQTRALDKEYGFQVIGRYISAWQTYFTFAWFFPGLKFAYVGGILWWFISYMNYWGWWGSSLEAFIEPFYVSGWLIGFFRNWETTQPIAHAIRYLVIESGVGSFIARFQPILVAIVVWLILSRSLLWLYTRQWLFWKSFEVVLTRNDIGVGKKLGFTGIKRVYRHGFEMIHHRERKKNQFAKKKEYYFGSSEVVLTFGPRAIRIADMYQNDEILEALHQQLVILDQTVARA